MDDRSERLQRRIEPAIIVATLLVIPVLILEGSDAGSTERTIATVGNWLIWLTFVAEAVVMLAVVPSRSRWLREHPLDVAIVVLTPPFLPTALASIRLLRLLRLVRLLRLAQYARGVFSLAGLRYAAFLALVTVITAGVGFASVERGRSTTDGMYWAITTMTTVGYGDLSPTTDTGRALAVVVMLVGIGFVAILTGAIAERFIAPAEEGIELDEAETLRRLQAIDARLDRLDAALLDLAAAVRSKRG